MRKVPASRNRVTHREIFSESGWIKPNLDCNNTFSDRFTIEHDFLNVTYKEIIIKVRYVEFLIMKTIKTHRNLFWILLNQTEFGL